MRVLYLAIIVDYNPFHNSCDTLATKLDVSEACTQCLMVRTNANNQDGGIIAMTMMIERSGMHHVFCRSKTIMNTFILDVRPFHHLTCGSQNTLSYIYHATIMETL